MIEDLMQLELLAQKTNNRRLIGVIRRFKQSQQLDEQILALASIIQSLRKKGVKYSQHFLQHCLLYILGD